MVAVYHGSSPLDAALHLPFFKKKTKNIFLSSLSPLILFFFLLVFFARTPHPPH